MTPAVSSDRYELFIEAMVGLLGLEGIRRSEMAVSFVAVPGA